jgi:hypothetical protein
MRLQRIGLAVAVVLAGAAACAASAPESPRTPGPRQTPGVPVSDTPLGEVATLALDTLSKHLSVSAKDIEILRIEPVEWRDSSLGCAKPDRGYMQVISPGHKAILQHGEREYAVHMSGKKAFVCEPVAGRKGEKEMPIAPLVTILTKEQLQQLAREDLAKRLGVSLEEITVARALTTEWRDDALGCPQPSQTYSNRRSKGHVFELQHRGRTFLYHSDLRRVIPCPPIEAN